MGDWDRARRTALVIGAALVLGCSGAADDGGTPSAASTEAGAAVVGTDHPSPTATATEVAPRSTAPPVAADDRAGAGPDSGRAISVPAPEAVIAAAVEDLSDRLDVAPGTITVLFSEIVVWPDDSIGCPLGDQQSIDGPARGARVHLLADGVLYRYHSGGKRQEPFLCDISRRSEVPIRPIEP